MTTFSLLQKTTAPFMDSKKVRKGLVYFLICLGSFDCIGQVPMIRLKMQGSSNYLDETILYYQEGATPGFDSEYDAYKISGPNNVPSISQEFNSDLMQINGISPVVTSFSINVKTTTNTSGNFTITATDFAFLPAGTCVSLHDNFTGNSVNILTNPYVFTLLSSTTLPRFTLEVTHLELPIQVELMQPTCQNINEGKFKIKGTSNPPWNYTWKDSVGTIIQSTLNSYHTDSLYNLSSGNYRVEVTSATNGCISNMHSFLIESVSLPMVSFSSPDTIVASVMQNYSPENLSENCSAYAWKFGNANNVSCDFEPIHTFPIPGLYEVSLKGTSFSGCIDSISKTVRVIALPTSVHNEKDNKTKLLSVGNNAFLLNLNHQDLDEIDIQLYNLEGKIMFSENFNAINENGIIPLDLNHVNTGMYILSITSGDKILVHNKILIH